MVFDTRVCVGRHVCFIQKRIATNLFGFIPRGNIGKTYVDNFAFTNKYVLFFSYVIQKYYSNLTIVYIIFFTDTTFVQRRVYIQYLCKIQWRHFIRY